MNRLTQLFANKKKNILNVYFTAGFPELNDTEGIILSLAESGVDLIEIGMPYSDPLADGPTIQQSGTKALENGMHLNLLFDQLKSVRQKTQVPLVLMGYFNQVMRFGDAEFFKKCIESGVDGLILPDMPLHVFENDYQRLLADLDLKMSFLITPQTTADRIRKIDSLTTGFVYMVSSYAITGGSSGISQAQIDYFKRIEKMKLKNPRLIGFGISDKATFDIACQHAQGAIIGSAFIRALERGHTEGVSVEETSSRFVNSILDSVLL
ncbi:MAG: tryptophan synthase subunit alpha [Saprospiraceae bacterium]|nr:tryptophan synthase subunit alpha [Saprospiraceae bacterium]